MKWGLFRAFMSAPLVLLVATQSAEGFWIKLGERVHQDITYHALYPNPGSKNWLGVNYPTFDYTFENGNSFTFSESAIWVIAAQNAFTDKDQTPVKHFDDEGIFASSNRLVDLRDQIVNLMVDESFVGTSAEDTAEWRTRVTKTWILLGQSLHTLQDFYAHSNWVEKYGLTQVSAGGRNLLKVWGVLPFAGGGGTCSDDNPGAAALTTGWASGGGLACFPPEGKCSHGLLDLVLYDCGINKDYSGRNPEHEFAVALAAEATRSFVKGIFDQVMRKRTRLEASLSPVEARNAVQRAICEVMLVSNADEVCVESSSANGPTGSFSCIMDLNGGQSLGQCYQVITGSAAAVVSADGSTASANLNMNLIYTETVEECGIGSVSQFQYSHSQTLEWESAYGGYYTSNVPRGPRSKDIMHAVIGETSFVGWVWTWVTPSRNLRVSGNCNDG